jgi:hypothetical protein
LEWFNYRNKLTTQNPYMRYIVIYNMVGKNVASCVIDKKELGFFPTGVKPRGFIVDYSLFFYETNDEGEAYYLSAVLNSNVINGAIKGFQDERNISRRPLMLPIPRYDPQNPIHAELARLGKACHEKVSGMALQGKGIGALRAKVREALKGEVARIDALVSELLHALNGLSTMRA